MKKLISLCLSLVLLLTCTSAFGEKTDAAARADKKLNIVVTIFPIYDWTVNVLGENPSGHELYWLTNTGVDLHSFQPSVDDMVRIASCDLLIYVGGESDEWVEDVLEHAANADMIVINLVEAMGEDIRLEELVEGMEHDHDEHDHDEHDHDEGDHDEHDHDEEDHDHEHEKEIDEHVWLSLRNAQKLTVAIAQGLCEADAANAQLYASNAVAYAEKLSALDEEYRQAVEAGTRDTVLFADRFPFRYLVDDYALKYYAAFAGCSAEAEASFETIVFLTNKTNELELSVILKLEGNNHRIADTIRNNSKTKNQQILVMDSMQSVTSADVRNGATYLGIMESNLVSLSAALR